MFFLFIAFIIFQRLTELAIARKNEKWMKSQGALEFGSGHYPAMVLIHSAFILSIIAEVVFFHRELFAYWPVLMVLFVLTQLMRVWALISLGPYWNTKIIVLPGAKIIKKGPYRLIKHPNYVIVALELIIIPLMFNAYWTAAIFTILNMVILSVRIPAEEKALAQLTQYEKEFSENGRFIPNLLNKYDN
jgi:methyltransferase